MIPVVYSEVLKNKKTPMFDIIYHLIDSEHESVPFTEIKITDEEQEQILAISQRRSSTFDAKLNCHLYSQQV